MVIEFSDDIIRVSHGFRDSQILRFIAVALPVAESKTTALKTGKDDITSFNGH
jgi:hypothetical protein